MKKKVVCKTVSLFAMLLIFSASLQSQYRWTKFSVGELGLGASPAFGSRIQGYIDGVDFSMGFGRFHGLGIGTKLLEFDMTITGADAVWASFCPIYFYYPLKMVEPKILTTSDPDRVRWFITLFGGGSLWGIDGQRYGNMGIMATNYIAWETRSRLMPQIFSFKSGLRFGGFGGVDRRTEVYFSVAWGPGFVRKKTTKKN